MQYTTNCIASVLWNAESGSPNRTLEANLLTNCPFPLPARLLGFIYRTTFPSKIVFKNFPKSKNSLQNGKN